MKPEQTQRGCTRTPTCSTVQFPWSTVLEFPVREVFIAIFTRRPAKPFEVTILERQSRLADESRGRLEQAIKRAESVNRLLDMTPDRGTE